ncbi:MAG TPA: serine hydrolase [Gryllotalpicola sp.]
MPLEHADPSALGIDAAAVARFADALDAGGHGVHGLVLARFGRVAAQGWWHPYRPDTPHMMYSVSKAFTSMAIGLAIEDGLIGLDEPTHDVFPEFAEIPGQTIRHLLTMTTGHDRDVWPTLTSLPGRDGAELFFAVPAPYPPGEHFVYSTGTSYVLAAALVRRTGRSLSDYLGARLFGPLGWGAPHWERDARGIELGGTGLKLTTGQLADFGQLLLQRGVWEGMQLVPAAWIDQASSRQVRNPWFDSHESRIGYGFQLWRSSHGFRADGAYGQFAVVIPELELVLATTSGSSNANAILETAWRELLPGVDAAFTPAGEPGGAALELAGRHVAEPGGEATDAVAEAALAGRSFTLQGNRLGVGRLTVRQDADTVTFELSGTGIATERLVAGRTEWRRGRTALWPQEQLPDVPYAARAGWADGALEVHQQLVGTPFRRIWRLFPDGPEGVRLTLDLIPDAGATAREDVLLAPAR